MSQQHTPGPWTAKGPHIHEPIPSFNWIATVQTSNMPEWEANARAIAAVPEMLEALKVAAKAELYDPATGLIDADVLDIVQDVARAAYVKATGGQP